MGNRWDVKRCDHIHARRRPLQSQNLMVQLIHFDTQPGDLFPRGVPLQFRPLHAAPMTQPSRHDPANTRDNGRRELTHRRSASRCKG